MQLAFDDTQSFRTNIDRLTPNTIPEPRTLSETHLRPIKTLARQFGIGQGSNELKNALYLARGGNHGLAVVLQNPCRNSRMLLESEMVKESRTLMHLDKRLGSLTNGILNIENTPVLDMYLLHPDWEHSDDTESDMSKKTRAAFNAFRQVMELLKPKVVLVCHCISDNADKSDFAQAMQSHMWSAGTRIEAHCIQAMVVKSFHPSMILRNDRSSYSRGRKLSKDDAKVLKDLRYYQFDMCLVMALQTLCGNQITRLYQFNAAAQGKKKLGRDMMLHDSPGSDRQDYKLCSTTSSDLDIMISKMSNMQVNDDSSKDVRDAKFTPRVPKKILEDARRQPKPRNIGSAD